MDLPSFFQQHPRGLLALSGGVDSALMAWAAGKYGAGWRACFVQTPFQPAHERADAETLADLCGLPLTVLEADVLADPQVAANPPRRGFRGSAKPRCLNRLRGRARHPPPHKPRQTVQLFPQNFSRCARKPGRCPVSARQRGSRGLNVPLAPALTPSF